MSRLKVTAAVVVLVALVTLLLPRRDPLHAATADFRVGLVFDVGGRGDKSFNDAAYAGLERAVGELNIHAETMEPSGAEDREAALRLFAARGFDLVIGVGFIFSSDIKVVAQAFPRTSFACVDYAPSPGEVLPPNLVGLIFREEEGAFLVGSLAGLMTNTRAVGFVGGMKVPLIEKFEVGYAAGVRHVCPTCRTLVSYAGTTPDAFRDPAKGEALATSAISAGADIVFHAAGSTGRGVFEAARDMGVKAIGVDSDQYDEMPEVVLTSMVKRVDVVVMDVIRQTKQEQFEGGLRTFGLREDGIDYVHEGPHAAGIPESVKDRLRIIRGEIIDGTIDVMPER